MKLLPLMLLATLAACISGSGLCGEQQLDLIRQVYKPGPLDPTPFSSYVFAQTTASALEQHIHSVLDLIGPPIGVRALGKNEATYVLSSATYDVPILINLDRNGRITDLLDGPPVQKTLKIEDALKSLDASSYLLSKDGKEVFGQVWGQKFNVGSAWQLGILSALQDDVSSGRRHWDDVTTLEKGDFAFTGLLRLWPVGSPITLHTLAAFVMGLDDPTAASALMHVVGRNEVASALGVPIVLSERELIYINNDDGLRTKYQSLAPAQRLAFLNEWEKQPLPAVTPLPGFANIYDLQEKISAETICRLVDKLAQLDISHMGVSATVPAQNSLALLPTNGPVFYSAADWGSMVMVAHYLSASASGNCLVGVWNGAGQPDITKVGGTFGVALGKAVLSDEAIEGTLSKPAIDWDRPAG